MSRRLTLAVVALASLAVAACSSAPTGPGSGIRTPEAINADSLGAVTDTTKRGGWSGSNG